MKASSLVRPLASISFLCVLIGGFEPFFIRSLFRDRSSQRPYYAELAYRKLPGLRQLMADVQSSTEPGASVAIWLGGAGWNRGYEYAYTRSVYLLNGRKVVPLLDRADVRHMENLQHAKYIACWRCVPDLAGFQVIWRSPHGALARRQ